MCSSSVGLGAYEGTLCTRTLKWGECVGQPRNALVMREIALSAHLCA